MYSRIFFQSVFTDYQKKITLKSSAKNIVPKWYFVFKIMCDISTLCPSSKMAGFTINRNSLNGQKNELADFCLNDLEVKLNTRWSIIPPECLLCHACYIM